MEAVRTDDHDAVTRESVGTQSTWRWRNGCRVKTTLQLKSIWWINPLQSLVSRASKTLAVEVPLHYSINGVGAYAGSCDVMLVNGDVVLIDYKTKRHGKYVHQKYLSGNGCSLLPTRFDQSSSRRSAPSAVTRTSSCMHIPRMASLSLLFLPKATCFLSINRSGLISR